MSGRGDRASRPRPRRLRAESRAGPGAGDAPIGLQRLLLERPSGNQPPSAAGAGWRCPAHWSKPARILSPSSTPVAQSSFLSDRICNGVLQHVEPLFIGRAPPVSQTLVIVFFQFRRRPRQIRDRRLVHRNNDKRGLIKQTTKGFTCADT